MTAVGTGEHGVGLGKREYLVEELGEGTVHLMQAIKNVVDPYGLLNPGKVTEFPYTYIFFVAENTPSCTQIKPQVQHPGTIEISATERPTRMFVLKHLPLTIIE